MACPTLLTFGWTVGPLVVWRISYYKNCAVGYLFEQTLVKADEGEQEKSGNQRKKLVRIYIEGERIE